MVQIKSIRSTRYSNIEEGMDTSTVSVVLSHIRVKCFSQNQILLKNCNICELPKHAVEFQRVFKQIGRLKY